MNIILSFYTHFEWFLKNICFHTNINTYLYIYNVYNILSHNWIYVFHQPLDYRELSVDFTDFFTAVSYFIDCLLQRRRGCTKSPNGTTSSFDVWAVNGMDFINFDPELKRWTSQSPFALQVQHRWNNKTVRNHALSHFIREQCPLILQSINLRSTPHKTGESWSNRVRVTKQIKHRHTHTHGRTYTPTHTHIHSLSSHHSNFSCAGIAAADTTAGYPSYFR